MAVVRDSGPSANQSYSFDAWGNDEDISPIITDITPDKTPFLSSLAEDEDAVETSFSWSTEALNPPQMNAHLEKEDYVSKEVGSVRSMDNVVQIFRNTGFVTDIQRKTKKVYNGSGDEFERQLTKAFIEHARDMEYAFVNGDVKRAGTKTAPALTGGIPFFLSTTRQDCSVNTTSGLVTTSAAPHNLSTGDFVYFTADTMPAGLTKNKLYYVRLDTTNAATAFLIFKTMKGAIENIAADKVMPTSAGTNLKIEKNNVTDLASSDYTIADINKVMEMCYYRGGNPSTLWMNPSNKSRFSDLVTGLASTQRKAGEKKGNTVATMLETDYGMVTARPHLWYPKNRIDAIDDQYVEKKWFERSKKVDGLAKKGNYSEFVIEGSIGLKFVQPLSCGSIVGIKD